MGIFRRPMMWLDLHHEWRHRVAVMANIFPTFQLAYAIEPPGALVEIDDPTEGRIVMEFRHLLWSATKKVHKRAATGLVVLVSGISAVLWIANTGVFDSYGPYVALAIMTIAFLLFAIIAGRQKLPVYLEARLLISQLDLVEAVRKHQQDFSTFRARALLNRRIQWVAANLLEVPLLLKSTDGSVVKEARERAAAVDGLQAWVSTPRDNTYDYLYARVKSDLVTIVENRWEQLEKAEVPTSKYRPRWIGRTFVGLAIVILMLGILGWAFSANLGGVGQVILVISVLIASFLWISSGIGITTFERVIDLSRKTRDLTRG